MMKNYYAFYEMMGYTAPYQKEFFGYFAPEKELIGGEPMKTSRAKLDPSVSVLQTVMQSRGLARKRLPYLELLCVSGPASFNTASQTLDLWVIFTRERMWLGLLFFKTFLGIINIVQNIRKQPKLKLLVAMSESDMSILPVKLSSHDVGIVYQLTHLSLRYKKYEDMPRNLYDENERIVDYLPNFPKDFVIGLGQDIVHSKTGFAVLIERGMGGKIGSIIQWFVKYVTFGLHLVKDVVRNTDKRLFHDLYRKDFLDRKKMSLKRKILRGAK